EGDLTGLGDVLGADGQGSGVIAALAATHRHRSRCLALELVTRLAPASNPAIVKSLQPLLADERLPLDERLAAAAALLQDPEADAVLSRAILSALISGLKQAKALERLRILEQQLGKHAAVEELCGRLERRLRMTCPLCAAKFRRPEMEQHVWAAHQRVLDGINVIEPWRLIEKWLETYRLHGGADGLERSLAFGQRL